MRGSSRCGPADRMQRTRCRTRRVSRRSCGGRRRGPSSAALGEMWVAVREVVQAPDLQRRTQLVSASRDLTVLRVLLGAHYEEIATLPDYPELKEAVKTRVAEIARSAPRLGQEALLRGGHDAGRGGAVEPAEGACRERPAPRGEGGSRAIHRRGHGAPGRPGGDGGEGPKRTGRRGPADGLALGGGPGRGGADRGEGQGLPRAVGGGRAPGQPAGSRRRRPRRTRCSFGSRRRTRTTGCGSPRRPCSRTRGRSRVWRTRARCRRSGPTRWSRSTTRR